MVSVNRIILIEFLAEERDWISDKEVSNMLSQKVINSYNRSLGTSVRKKVMTILQRRRAVP